MFRLQLIVDGNDYKFILLNNYVKKMFIVIVNYFKKYYR